MGYRSRLFQPRWEILQNGTPEQEPVPLGVPAGWRKDLELIIDKTGASGDDVAARSRLLRKC